MAKGQIVNRKELADVFGVSLPTVDNWVRNGCPYEKKPQTSGDPWEFNTARVAKWREDLASRVGDQVDADEARRRKMAAEAALSEIELEKVKGELIRIEDVAEVVGNELSRVRAKLLSIPSKAAPVVLTFDSVQEAERYLEDGIVEALNEIRAGDEYGTP